MVSLNFAAIDARDNLNKFARVAKWQTRWLQVPVPARAWGFKSPLAHEQNPGLKAGVFCLRNPRFVKLNCEY